MGTLYEGIYTFMTAPCRILTMRNVSNNMFRENQNTHFIFNNLFSKHHAIYKIRLKNMAEPATSQATI
jgi:hypothetical protein